MKAAGLGHIRMRKGSWNAKVVHLVATLNTFIPGVSLNVKVGTQHPHNSHF